MAFGAGEALLIVDELQSDPALRNYYLLPTVRGDLLEKLGRHDEARSEFERAAGLTRNEREKDFLLGRAHNNIAVRKA
jgi:predicted RNA polymerase sigma factor